MFQLNKWRIVIVVLTLSAAKSAKLGTRPFGYSFVELDEAMRNTVPEDTWMKKCYGDDHLSFSGDGALRQEDTWKFPDIISGIRHWCAEYERAYDFDKKESHFADVEYKEMEKQFTIYAAHLRFRRSIHIQYQDGDVFNGEVKYICKTMWKYLCTFKAGGITKGLSSNYALHRFLTLGNYFRPALRLLGF